MLVEMLIIFFLFLIIYQFLLASTKYSTIEGLDNYQPYDMNNPNNALILAQQNAGNIQVLKGQLDTLNGLKTQVDSLQTIVDQHTTQITGIVQQQSSYAQQVAGSTPPTISGTQPLTVNDVVT
jgi:hypothetical protein